MKQLLSKILNKYTDKSVKDLSKFLFLFNIRGEPCSLDEHHMFTPSFQTDQPKRTLWKVARQLGKTTNAITLPNLLRSILCSNWTTLTMAPRFEQAKRISTDFTDAFIKSSEFKSAFTDADTRRSVLKKTFSNGSTMHFSYAFLDVGRVRGIPGVDDWKIDEVQHMNWDFIPIIRETASASPFGFETFCGTPLTFDNTIEKLWQEGTQSEFIITCEHCNTTNIPSMEYHLEQMIGKKSVICHSCGKKLNVYNGEWVARFPGRRNEMVSRHLPQIVSPLHCYNEKKWLDLLYKMNNYNTAQLYNEVFGESYDRADKLFTIEDLKQTCIGVKYSIKEAKKRSSKLKNIGMAVDWTGGGIDSDSFTSVVIGGMRPESDTIEVIYAAKIPKNYNPNQECMAVLELRKYFRANWIAHDYGGVGRAYEFILFHNGLTHKQIIPFSYVISPRQSIVYPLMMNNGERKCYNLDKIRSIVVLSTMLKSGKIILPDWESMERNENGNPFRDLLSLFTEQKESMRGSDIFYIKRTAGTPDDTAHALNLLCTAQWCQNGQYPNVQEAMQMKMTKEMAEALCPAEDEKGLFLNQSW